METKKFLAERTESKKRELLELKNKLSSRWFLIFCFYKMGDVKEEISFYEETMLPEYDKALEELKKGNRKPASELMEKIVESMAFRNFLDYGFREPPAVRRVYEKVLTMREALAE